MRRISLGMVLTLVAIACGGDGEAADPTASTTISSTTPAIGGDGAGPGSIALTLDSSAAVSAEIGAEGGELTTTSSSGVAFTLTVPVGALLSPVTITMTPIADASGDPLGAAPVAAVHLAPEGQHFLRAVTLTAAGAALTDPVGIGASGDGGDFHLLPARVVDGALAVQTTHFSTVGFSAAEQLLDLVDSYRPTTAETLATTALVLADEDFGEAFAVLAVWAEVVQDGLERAEATSGLEQVTVEMLSLFMRIDETLQAQAFVTGEADLPAGLNVQVQGILDLWFGKVGADVARLGQFCAEDPASAFWVYRWVLIGAAITEFIGVDRSDLLTTWAEQASECLTFEVSWDAGVGLVDAAGVESLTVAGAVAVLKGPVRFDTGAAQVIGELVVTETDYTAHELEFGDCTPRFTDGRAQIGLELDVTLENPPSAQSVEIANFVVVVDGDQPPRIECEELIAVGRTQDWAGWFFTIPVSLINADRLVLDGAWGFGVPVTSDSGEMGVLDLEESDTRSGTTATIVQLVAVTHTGS